MTGDDFKKVRKHLKLSQSNMALFMGVSRRTLQEIENSPQVKPFYEHSILWIAQQQTNTRFDDDYEPIVDDRPDVTRVLLIGGHAVIAD